MAAKSQDDQTSQLPRPADLVRLSQCGGSDQDLLNMEKSISDKLQGECAPVTALDFLVLFYRLIVEQETENLLPQLIRHLEVLTCQHEFTKFRVSSATFLSRSTVCPCDSIFLAFVFFF